MSDLPRVLLIGAGFAGERFAKVLRHLGEDLGHVLLVGACDPRTRLRDRGDDVPHYTELDRAVEELSPDAFVVAVNERDHYPVLRNLAERVGDRRHLVMCEKPMVSNVSEMETLLTLPGWAQLDLRLHMVERHSKVVEDFRWWLAEAGAVRFLRAEFFWGKNRVSDQRPTMGVLSEIIHPLDLIQFITGEQVAGCRSMVVRSDYPIHRSMTQETLDLAGGLGTSGLVVGHTSFAWTARDRRITFHFETADAVYAATLSFDMPRWDCDALRVDRLGGGGIGDHGLLELRVPV